MSAQIIVSPNETTRGHVKSNQIGLLAKAPLIRSTGAPSTGLQLPNMKQYNVSKLYMRYSRVGDISK